jgi:phosphoribosylaminoimidazole-succinocarboxamide synthase
VVPGKTSLKNLRTGVPISRAAPRRNQKAAPLRGLRPCAASANFAPPHRERDAESDPRAGEEPRAFFVSPTGKALAHGEGATMTRRKKIYEGKAKILYEGPEPGTLIQYFKDDTTAFDATKKAVLEGKGVINNRISEHIMTRLNSIGVQNHFIKRLNLREQLIREVEIIPLEVVCRNVAAGSLATRLGLPEGQALPRSIIEFYLKDDKLHDPMVAEEHITAFNWASTQEIDDMMALTLRVNDFLTGMFGAVGITLIDFKIEFGRVWENDFARIILADEISPDSCRLWDSMTNEKLDKDRFRRDLGNVIESYTEVARRLGIMKEMPTVIQGGLH